MLAGQTVEGTPWGDGAVQHHRINRMVQPIAVVAVEGLLGEKE